MYTRDVLFRRNCKGPHRCFRPKRNKNICGKMLHSTLTRPQALKRYSAWRVYCRRHAQHPGHRHGVDAARCWDECPRRAVQSVRRQGRYVSDAVLSGKSQGYGHSSWSKSGGSGDFDSQAPCIQRSLGLAFPCKLGHSSLLPWCAPESCPRFESEGFMSMQLFF